MIRSGIGYDVHKLAKGEKLIIGGIDIPTLYGSVGHSDGDGLIHAIVDALLGATGLGDIGKYFPSEDQKWENASSIHFLSQVVKLVRETGFEINNIDSTIILQKPKISEFIPKMKNNLASSMDINESQVSIKATTTDNLGFVGDGSGWAVQAIATIYLKDGHSQS